MSQQQQGFSFNLPAGTVPNLNYLNFNFNDDQTGLDAAKSADTRRDSTKFNVDRLYQLTLIRRPGEQVIIRAGRRQNKNEILGLTLARLVKEKHLHGSKYLHDIELSRGIQMKVNNDDFVMILRTDGRIVVMSDEVEQHLGKSMRSLYTQCINIFQCLDRTDGDKLRTILNTSNDLVQQEHRLVCTFRLPKGKRPSRIREDIKTILMAGHFYFCHDSSSASNEKLFIARCQALVSRTTNGSNVTQTTMVGNTNTNNDNIGSMIKMIFNEDMSINFASPNVKDVLGYSRTEMIGNWFGRYLSTSDLAKFEAIRQKYFQHEAQQQAPMSVCDIFDIYASNGDGRLTFLCQIRPMRERRSKAIKFHLIGQMIDPSLRSEYIKYVDSESGTDSKSIKPEQVNHVPSSISKTSKDSIVANSPSLAMGLLVSDNTYTGEHTYVQRYSPFHRSLSNAVAPVNIDDESWRQLLELDFNQYSITPNFQYSTTKSFDDPFIEYRSESELNGILNDCFDEYLL